MRKKIVAGNWKMNTSVEEGISLIKELSSYLKDAPKCEVMVFPPALHLVSLKEIAQNTVVQIGAQNLYFENNGAFTGEISATMLKDSGINLTLVGHSERRQYFNESNEILNKKVKKALEFGLTPVYCCGEVLEERESGKLYDIVEEQISVGLFDLNEEDFSKIIIAYEPVWAIGTGVTASPAQAEEMHAFIRSLIEKKYSHEIASNCSILYGGSVKSSNSEELFSQPNIDGGLVGGASLKAEEFYKIIISME